MDAHVTNYVDNIGATGNFTQVNDQVDVLLVYEPFAETLNVGSASVNGSSRFYELNSNISRFSISIAGLTWEHDYGLGDLSVRAFNNHGVSTSDRFDASARGVDSSTFPFAQAGLNYFVFQLIDTDGNIWDSLELPDEQTQFNISSLEFHNGIVQSRDIDSSLLWYVNYEIDHVRVSSIPEPQEFLAADFDENGTVEFADFLFLSEEFGNSIAPAGTAPDINGNGIVDFADFLVLSGSFGQSAGAPTAVPEPTSLSLLLFGGVLLGVLRRKRFVASA